MQENENEYMKKPDTPLPAVTAENYIENDFEFVKALKNAEIDGKIYLQDKDGNFLNSNTRLTESEFINRWLDGFTLGRVGKTSYFDFNTWLNFTNHGGEAVLVVEDNDPTKVLFVIPPLAVPNFTLTERVAVATAGKAMATAKYAVENKDNLKATKLFTEASEIIKQYVSDESVHLSNFIPRSYFERFNIIPEVKQNLIYCRDVFGLNPNIEDDWNFATNIFEKIYYHEELTKEEITFMGILCDGKWKVPTYQGEKPVRPAKPNDISKDKVVQGNTFISAEPISEAVIVDDPFAC